jgi:hypothetical protein
MPRRYILDGGVPRMVNDDATLVAIHIVDGTPTAYWSDGSVYIQDRATNTWHHDSKIPSPNDRYVALRETDLRGYYEPDTSPNA